MSNAMGTSTNWFYQGVLNSYSQIFFSDNRGFSYILFVVSFLDVMAGLLGLLSVLVTTITAYGVGLSHHSIQKGYYGFNSLLVGLGIGMYYSPSLQLLFLVIIAAIFTLFLSVALEGVIGKYYLPHLSLPFVFGLWMLMLSTREFYALSLHERWIFTLNDLYVIGGPYLVNIYQWWNEISIPVSVRAYFLSLGAILFQTSVFSGVLIAIGLLVYSRIAFTLSILGFYGAWFFYLLIGAELSAVGYSYVGFNYILTAIAVGGFFIIPGLASYFWVLLVVPMVAIVAISLSSVLYIVQLPVYALPFNVVVLIFLYVLQFRVRNTESMSTYFVQRNSPERNFYAYISYKQRFAEHSEIPLSLPFFGEWVVTQGHNGEYTHKSDWKHAWDFEIADNDGLTYKNKGDYPEDYYCYNKSIIAPADGVIEDIVNDIPENIIGTRNLEHNWGNTVVIKHSDTLYTKLCHLKKDSIKLKIGDKVRQGEILGLCGNSGNSPVPHLHFQVQTTPFIGSKTISYPLSTYRRQRGNQLELIEVGIPEKGDKVSDIQVNDIIKKGFLLVPGRVFEFKVNGLGPDHVRWEVKVDSALNTYIECETTDSKVFVETGSAIIYLVHFEGDRNSLLYHFYLSSYKVCFGFDSGQILHDEFPVNQVFTQANLLLQDFIAPFYLFKKATFKLKYPELNGKISPNELVLKSEICAYSFGREKPVIHATTTLDIHGIKSIEIESSIGRVTAICER